MNKDKLLQCLVGYRNSMTEFDTEEMDYLIALVNFDIKTKQLSTKDVEYWTDHEIPENTSDVKEFYRSVEYMTKMKKLMLEDLIAMQNVEVINDVP